ncbi:Major Facilitator Superfamily [Penicillium brevicompactum]
MVGRRRASFIDLQSDSADATHPKTWSASEERPSTSTIKANPRLLSNERQLPEYELNWNEGDHENPRNWSLAYKSFVVATMGFGATVISLASTCYSVTIPGLQDELGITKMVGLLGITTYLLGMAVGSLFLAPLSEMYGRRPVYVVSMGLFAALTVPVALARNIETILVFRFLSALFGSAMMSNSPGSVNDVVSDHHRPMAFGFWAIGPSNGPVLGSIIGGFVYQYLGWRWSNWIIVIIGGVTFALMILVKETYAPILLRKRAQKRRQHTKNPKWWSSHDNHLPFITFCRINISRQIVMIVTEPICIFWNSYVAISYGILYLCFVSYPIAFQTNRGWSPGIGGLSYLGIGCGTLTTIFLEPVLRAWIQSHPKDPNTGKVPPEATVKPITIGAVLLAMGQIWFAWTSTPNVHWVVPILAGIPFGAGNAALFIYASNYLAHSYGEFAASALAGNTVVRSILGAVLPLAGPSMYASLGLNWAGFVLGMAEVACILIPFVFLYNGHRIRRSSPLIQEMKKKGEANLTASQGLGHGGNSDIP